VKLAEPFNNPSLLLGNEKYDSVEGQA